MTDVNFKTDIQPHIQTLSVTIGGTSHVATRFSHPMELRNIFIKWHTYFSTGMHGLAIHRPETSKFLMITLYCLLTKSYYFPHTTIDCWNPVTKQTIHVKTIRNRHQTFNIKSDIHADTYALIDTTKKNQYTIYEWKPKQPPHGSHLLRHIIRQYNLKPIHFGTVETMLRSHQDHRGLYIHQVLAAIEESDKIENSIDKIIQSYNY